MKLLCKEGDTIPLGGAVAVILEQGEEFDESLIQGRQGSSISSSEVTEKLSNQRSSSDQTPQAQAREIRITPMVRAYAKKLGVELSEFAGYDRRISKEDIDDFLNAQKKKNALPDLDSPAGEPSRRIRISPVAKKMAEEMAIDPRSIIPKDGKRITKEDVLAYQSARQSLEKPKRDHGRRETMRGMRRVIAENMTKSYFIYPAVTLTTDVNMSPLLELRSQLNEELTEDSLKISITDMLIKAVAMALMDNEIVNTSLIDDEIVYHEMAHIGVAVALEVGLVVPVIREANRLSLKEISVENKRLIGLAKSGSLEPDDMHGGTFTVTNLGILGIDAFNPIINYPESAILGVGRSVERPVVRNGHITIETRAVLSLTHDHRVIDGAPAAYFLRSVAKYIEKPFLLLMEQN